MMIFMGKWLLYGSPRDLRLYAVVIVKIGVFGRSKLPELELQHHFDGPVVLVVSKDVAGKIFSLEYYPVGHVTGDDLVRGAATGFASKGLVGGIVVILDKGISV